LQAAVENGEDGEGAIRKKEVTQDLEPDDHELDGMFSLKGLGVADEWERAAGGEGRVEGVIWLDLP
jgi:hypothetical protein